MHNYAFGVDFVPTKRYNAVHIKEYFREEFTMSKGNIKKIVLAYSGGLDTSIIIPWLKENYNNPEIIAVAGNVGQADELEGLEERPLRPAPAS